MSHFPYPRVASLKTAAAFRVHLTHGGIRLPFDDELAAPAESPLAQPIEVDGVRVYNRFCILPMEGWDGTPDGEPTDLTRRRWRNFGISGAKLIWGGEAVAVRHDGRANPNQLLLTPKTQRSIAALRTELTRRTASASVRTRTATCTAVCSSRTPAVTRGRTCGIARSRSRAQAIPCSTADFRMA